AWLDGIAPGFKIASGDMTYTRLLETVAATGKPILLSTGASDLDEVRAAKKTIDDVWTADGVSPGLVLLHCTVSYPTAPEDANLSAIPDLARLGTTVGFSDHTIGIEAAVLSVALGARA
ncbi:MAG: N-acetylneuraminate synthase family protein, partial [Alphaproteobacteria bacterium]